MRSDIVTNSNTKHCSITTIKFKKTIIIKLKLSDKTINNYMRKDYYLNPISIVQI